MLYDYVIHKQKYKVFNKILKYYQINHLYKYGDIGDVNYETNYLIR